MKAKSVKDDMIQTLTSGQPQYPSLLKEIRGYPETLYYIGDVDILKRRKAAVVGSRKANQYGRYTSFSISKRLAQRGIAVVSGMALGIDTCAHQGALKGQGATIAVFGCGVDICYPKANGELKAELEKSGLLLSEYPPGSQPRRYCFPQRNRIISGLSEITIVVQAGNNSGALITAELAAEQGREVYVVPGNIDSEYSWGSNKLLKDGALPLISAEDALEAMGAGSMSSDEAKILLSPLENSIYSLLETHGEMTLDELCRAVGKPAGFLGGVVTVMEMKGTVFSCLGKIFIAKE